MKFSSNKTKTVLLCTHRSVAQLSILPEAKLEVNYLVLSGRARGSTATRLASAMKTRSYRHAGKEQWTWKNK